MTVDLSTLKEGDSIKLRNGDVHKVTVINKTGSAYNVEYGIGTKNIRIITGTDRRQYSGHSVTGHCGINQEQPGDIVEIIPALSITYGRGDWNFGPREENVTAGVKHSRNWVEKEIQKTQDNLKRSWSRQWPSGAVTDIPKQENGTNAVDNPNHYASENGKQLWDLMPDMGTKEEFLGYCKFNVIKYVNRYNKKNGIEDLRKAIKYCERMVEFLESGK